MHMRAKYTGDTTDWRAYKNAKATINKEIEWNTIYNRINFKVNT